MHHNTLGYASKNTTTAEETVLISTRSGNRHQRISHTYVHTQSIQTPKHMHNFPVVLARWQGPHKDWNSWDQSELLKACLVDCLSSSPHSEYRVMWLETWMMYNRSRSTGFPLKSHYTHKWNAWVQSTDRVSESAATAVRASSCQGGE